MVVMSAGGVSGREESILSWYFGIVNGMRVRAYTGYNFTIVNLYRSFYTLCSYIMCFANSRLSNTVFVKLKVTIFACVL